MRALLIAFLVAGLAACSGGGGGDDGGANQSPTPPGGNPPPPPPPPPSPPTVTGSAIVPNNATPPVALTFEVGITENVPLAQMQQLFATFVAVNNALWNVSEGQIRIGAVNFRDAVVPGLPASIFVFGGGGAINTAGIDILVWPRAQWDLPAEGAVGEQPGQGRSNRLMVIPDDVRTFVLLHECGHLIFRLTWSAGGLLVDEYNDGVQDDACLMESENLPLRFCSDSNHVHQPQVQPHSCWRQILQDHPNFRHTGADTAPGLPPAPNATYSDTP